MPIEKSPAELIAELASEMRGWSDADVLVALEGLAPLAYEDDASWNVDGYWWTVAYRYLALGNVAAERKLRPAVRLLLERACNGDPGEIMRGLRHTCERIFNPEWTALADVCLPLCTSPRTGTRVWAVHQLMILDDPRARPAFERALTDESEEVRSLAAMGLERLGPS